MVGAECSDYRAVWRIVNPGAIFLLANVGARSMNCRFRSCCRSLVVYCGSKGDRRTTVGGISSPWSTNATCRLRAVPGRIQYADGLKIDFSLWPVELLRRIVDEHELPAELDAGYLVLVDKDGLTRGLRPPTYTGYVPTRPTEEVYQKTVEDFFSDVPYAAKCLWRGELLPLKWCLDYDMKHLFLRQMLEWHMECEHGWSVAPGAFGKGLQKWLRPELWAELEKTYANAETEDNWDALLRTVALFRWAAQEVGAQLGYTYPEDLDKRVMDYAKQVRALTHQG